MSGLARIFTLIAIMWCFQLWLAWRQAKRFQGDLKKLRAQGSNVAIGVGGRRYRGGRAFVAIVTNPEGVVVDGLLLSGLSVFAKSKPLKEYTGFSIDDIISGNRAVSSAKVKEAAISAAEYIRSHLNGESDGE